MPRVTLREMIEGGAHYGHRTNKWNPKMKKYIFGKKDGIHIIDLQQTLGLFDEACEAAKNIVANGGNILFVGTKKQAQNTITEEAKRADMPYVSYRWLGGMLTNFKTIKQSIDKLKRFEQMIETDEIKKYSKKEILKINKQIQKLDRNLGGLKKMTKLPKAVFIVDIKREHLAVKDAINLGIPVFAMVDTNVDPDLVNYPIPANDDAIKSIRLFLKGFTDACLEGKRIYEEKVKNESKDGARIEKKKSGFRPKGGKKTFKIQQNQE
jgi:small subunit ribosomal protein S2